MKRHELTDAELEQSLRNQGVEVVDAGSIENAPVEDLLGLFGAIDRGEAVVATDVDPEAYKGMLAAILLDRGELRGCGCAVCSRLRDYARAWKRAR